MKATFTRSTLLILLSAVLYALGVIYVQFYLAWIAFIPFFIATHHLKASKVFRSGALFGLSFCAVLLYQMISLVGDYAGKTVYGFVFYGIALVLSMVYFGLLTSGIAWLTGNKKPIWLNALLASSLWTLGEWIYSTALPGMPWFGLFRVSNIVLANLYAIQAATIGGAFLISFCIILVNYFAAHFIAVKKWKLLVVPAGIIVLYQLGGYAMFRSFEEKFPESGKPITVAILCDNTTPDVKWNEENGSFLVKKLLELNKMALVSHADIALWSESVVPWTYRTDDDFIKEIVAMTAGRNMTHVIGMTSDYSPTEIYNSAYAILPGGTIAGRYDKRFPVSFAEKPVGNISLPAGGSGSRIFEKEGSNPVPLSISGGKAGVLICNDGTAPGAAVSSVKNGADFLLSLSNDAWFSHVSFLVDQHFYNTRLRAVEVRKDLAINSNMGPSGVVKASGAADIQQAGENNTVQIVHISSNKYLTVYASYPLTFVYINAFFILIFIAVTSFYSLKLKLNEKNITRTYVYFVFSTGALCYSSGFFH